MNILNISMSSLIMFALVACGGGGGTDNDENNIITPVPVITRDVKLNGTASLGTALTGVVAVYPVTAQGVSRLVNLAGNLVTDDDGRFSLTLSDLEVDVIYVEVESDGRMLRCGIEICERQGDATGTLGVKFGDEYIPKKKITLGGIVSVRNSNKTPQNASVARAENASLSVQANLNAFTQLAAKFAESKVSGSKSLVDTASEANVQVVNRFRLGTDLLTLTPVSLIQADSVNSANKYDLKSELKSAGLLASGLDVENIGTITDSLALIINQYINIGIADTESSPSEASITIEKSLAKANILLEKVGALPNIDTASAGYSGAKSELASEERFAQNGSTSATQGDVAADYGAAGLQAVKAFSTQIRNFANVVVGASPSQEALNFQSELDLASNAASIDASIIGAGLAMAADAITFAYETYYDDNTIAEVTYENITVAITTQGNNVKYTVSQLQTIGGSQVSINVTATDFGSYDNSTETEPQLGVQDFTADINVELGVSGSVYNENLELQFFDNSTAESKLVFKLTGTQNSEDYESADGYDYGATLKENMTISAASVDLLVIMKQRANTVDDPITFTGNLVFSLSNFKSTADVNSSYHSEPSGGSYNSDVSVVETYDLDAASFTLSGIVASESGKSLSATISSSISNLHFGCTSSYVVESSPSVYNSTDEDDCDTSGETQSDFADISISILLNLDLPALADDATLEITGVRTGLEAAAVAVYALYDGQVLDIDFNYDVSAPRSVTITNHNQVVLTLNESDTGVISGFMSIGGVRYADIDEDAGFVTVTYSDGSFESFM